ncbi:MAG TPA: DHH family phosphoesterase [Candidatus Paceibacterota bacterium]|nr:DHH family phosphoesterase [Verrucomicrobiota bacterium]HRY47467.1 DHH family phosphoesterase [Candidatus Paceibacterota bacterium]
MSEPQEKPAAASLAERLRTFLAERRESLSPLLILTHDFPDPDALASAYALQHLAQTGFGISCRIAYGGEVGRTENKAMIRLLRIPAHRLKPIWFKQHAGIALVDTQPHFENNAFPANRRATVVIDQHPSPSPAEADLVLLDSECGATSVILARALLQHGTDIPNRVATALAYGILTDTLDLYRARREDVVQTYLEILQHCDMRTLARIQNPMRSRRFFATLGKGIREASQYRRLLVTHLGLVETPDLVSQVAEFLLAYRRIAWCLVTGRYQGRLHASLRTTRTDTPAGPVLRDAFGNPKQAGGHGPIAGGSCRIGRDAEPAAWEACEQKIQAGVVKRLRIAASVDPRKPFVR